MRARTHTHAHAHTHTHTHTHIYIYIYIYIYQYQLALMNYSPRNVEEVGIKNTIYRYKEAMLLQRRKHSCILTHPVYAISVVLA